MGTDSLFKVHIGHSKMFKTWIIVAAFFGVVTLTHMYTSKYEQSIEARIKRESEDDNSSWENLKDSISSASKGWSFEQYFMAPFKVTCIFMGTCPQDQQGRIAGDPLVGQVKQAASAAAVMMGLTLIGFLIVFRRAKNRRDTEYSNRVERMDDKTV